MRSSWKPSLLRSPGIRGGGASHVNYIDPLFADPPRRGTTGVQGKTTSSSEVIPTYHFRSALGIVTASASAADDAIAGLAGATTTIRNNLALPWNETFYCTDAMKTHVALQFRLFEDTGELHEDVAFVYRIPAFCTGIGVKSKLDGYWGRIVYFSNNPNKYYWIWRPLNGVGFLRSEIPLTVYTRLFLSSAEKIEVHVGWDSLAGTTSDPLLGLHAAPYDVFPSQTRLVEDNVSGGASSYWLVVAASAAAVTSKHKIDDIPSFDYCGFNSAEIVTASSLGITALQWNAIPVGWPIKINQTTVLARSA